MKIEQITNRLAVNALILQAAWAVCGLQGLIRLHVAASVINGSRMDMLIKVSQIYPCYQNQMPSIPTCMYR